MTFHPSNITTEWLNLMILFSIILMFIDPMNFFYKMESMSPMKKSKMILKYWKW